MTHKEHARLSGTCRLQDRVHTATVRFCFSPPRTHATRWKHSQLRLIERTIKRAIRPSSFFLVACLLSPLAYASSTELEPFFLAHHLCRHHQVYVPSNTIHLCHQLLYQAPRMASHARSHTQGASPPAPLSGFGTDHHGFFREEDRVCMQVAEHKRASRSLMHP